MSRVEKELEEALGRIVANKTINIPPGSDINNDTVAAEAGRGRGTIRESRYPDLVTKISDASVDNIPKEKILEKRVEKLKNDLKETRRLYLGALNREIMLNVRLHDLEAIVKADNVVSIT